jgi:hypothetical protein
MSTASTIRDYVQLLASRDGGVSVSEVSGYTAKQVRAAIWVLKQAGAVHTAKLSHRSVRYFTDKNVAQACEAKNRRATATDRPVSHVGKRNTVTHKSQRAWWPEDAPMVFTDATKITIAPSPPTPARTNTHNEWGGA